MLLKQFNDTMFPRLGITVSCDKKAVLSWHTLMNFVIHFTFKEFVNDLPKDSVVYLTAFTQTILSITEQYVLMSSEATTAGGTIHVARLVVEADKEVKSSAASAAEKFKELLVIKGMVCRRGVLLTEGLEEGMRVYGKTSITYSLNELDEMIAEAKEGQANE